MEIKVLGISGSPTGMVILKPCLKVFLKELDSSGATVEKVVLKKLQYSPCRGCNSCHKTGECIVHDDAIILYEKVLASDCLAVASPIYTMGITVSSKGLLTGSNTSGPASLF